jgi:hypothetical protein
MKAKCRDKGNDLAGELAGRDITIPIGLDIRVASHIVEKSEVVTASPDATGAGGNAGSDWGRRSAAADFDIAPGLPRCAWL